MSDGTKRLLTPEEYLAIERDVEAKHEFYRGEMFAMGGASREHNLITGNAGASLHAQLANRPCEAYQNDMRVKVAANGLYPPDDPEMPEIPWYTTTWHFLKHTFTGDSALYEVLEDRNAKYRATLEARFARVCEIRMPDSAQYEKQCGR